MKNRSKAVAILGGGFFSLLAMLAVKASPSAAITQVIHISVDGLGAKYLETYLSNAPAEFPNFHRLRTEGAWTFNARCDYDLSMTLGNHSSMLTGRPVLQPEGWTNTAPHGITFDTDPGGTIHEYGNTNVPYKASVLDVAHDHGLSTAFYASKKKFAFFVRSWDTTNGAPDLVGTDNGRNKITAAMITDATTNRFLASEILMDAVVRDLAGEPRNYTFLHFAETDYAGHYDGWDSPAYSNAVRHVDQQLGRLLAAIEASATNSRQLAIIITADHGGFEVSHDDATLPSIYTIPFFLWSPGIAPGANLYSLFGNRGDPGTNRLDFNAWPQPLRNGDTGNLALFLLGLPIIPGSSLIPVFGSPPVWTRIVKSDADFTLYWPVVAGGFTLQTTPDLVAPANWRTITEGITTNGTSLVYPFIPAPDTPTRFFRLRRP